jgi:hypothetical protein
VIGALRQLRVLAVENQQLSTLPPEIGYLQRLELLSVHESGGRSPERPAR